MSFWSELKRRNVFRVATAYAVVAWLLVQVASILLPTFSAAPWVMQGLVVFLAIGFPVALALAWVFESAPAGRERAAQAGAISRGRRLSYATAGLLALAVLLVIGRFLLEPDATSTLATGVDPAAADAGPKEGSGLSATETGRPRVAVLPCDEISPTDDNAFFTAGVHEEILNRLAKLEGLLVIARTSVLQYAGQRPAARQIATELNATAVMDCSVRYAGENFFVTAQLVDPDSDTVLWTENYPGTLADLGVIFAMQTDIASEIASALQTTLSTSERERLGQPLTTSVEAYTFYLKAREQDVLSASDVEEAHSLLDQALAYDPQFAHAYGMKAILGAYSLNLFVDANLDFGSIRSEQMAVVRDNAQQALELDRDVPDAYRALGMANVFSWYWGSARSTFEQGLDLSPNDSDLLVDYGWFLSCVLDESSGVDYAERATAVDPNNAFAFQTLAQVHLCEGERSAAYEAATRAVELAPTSFPNRAWQALAGLTILDRSESLSQFQLLEPLFRDQYVVWLPTLMAVYKSFGRPDDVQRMFDRFVSLNEERRTGSAAWVRAYLVLDDYDKAYEALEDAVSNPGPDSAFSLLVNIKKNPAGNRVLNEPRFAALRDRLQSFD